MVDVCYYAKVPYIFHFISFITCFIYRLWKMIVTVIALQSGIGNREAVVLLPSYLFLLPNFSHYSSLPKALLPSPSAEHGVFEGLLGFPT